MNEHLTTERLRLRPLRESDGVWVARHGYTPGVARMTGSMIAPNTVQAAAMFAMLQPILRRRGLSWHYAIEAGGEPIGACGIVLDGEGRRDLGYWIGEPWWGRGYASELVAAVVAEHDAVRPDEALHARVFHDNPASLRVLEKSGFVVTGEEPGYCMQRRGHVDGFRLIRPASTTLA